MSKSRIKNSFSLINGIIIGTFIGISSQFVLAAWTPPAGGPPNNNVAAPVNVSAVAQVKNGDLSVTTLFDTDDALYYLNPAALSSFNAVDTDGLIQSNVASGWSYRTLNGGGAKDQVGSLSVNDVYLTSINKWVSDFGNTGPILDLNSSTAFNPDCQYQVSYNSSLATGAAGTLTSTVVKMDGSSISTGYTCAEVYLRASNKKQLWYSCYEGAYGPGQVIKIVEMCP